jgi:hypothetical protein
MTMPLTDIGQFGQHRFQGLGAAGGGADGHHAVGGVGHGARAGGLGGEHDIGGELRWRCQRAGGTGDHPAHVGPGGGAHGRDEVVTGILEELLYPALGLGDDGQGTRRQRIHGRGGTLFGERGTDDGRRRMLGHDLLEEGEPVHARHFDADQEARAPDGDRDAGAEQGDDARFPVAEVKVSGLMPLLNLLSASSPEAAFST